MLANLSDIDLKMLRIFCSIVEAGGFTAAQVPLNTSLPRLSVTVRDLEARLGYTLCRRGKGGFQLTEQGAQVYAAAQELYADMERFRQRLVLLNAHHPETLRVGSLDNLITLQPAPLPYALGKLREAIPDTRLVLQVLTAEGLEQAVINGDIDLAIGVFDHQLSGLHYLELFGEEQNLYCGQGHPIFGRADSTLSDADIFSAQYVDRGLVVENRKPFTFPFNSVSSAASTEAVASLVASGHFIGYLPTHYADVLVARGVLRPIWPARFAYHATCHCITRQGSARSASMEIFIDALLAAAALASQA
ncbi:LysR family transcriptional regulator [Pseudomonas sp. sia0905]|uniref:LysR family transcriptional regulator n=1 Tax=Pseudomonas sp. sia0905 TaxID=2854783 RepID=UPI001C45A7DF|nr:LysR family transcriptional regulator [Pseudomonas sp. sia0905]MBV7565020.1 LysR family transcriptional regulator [Pseudomonas sp. sia0905]